MNKTWLIIEKVTGALIGIWGVVTLYSITSSVASMIQTGYTAAHHITYLQLIQTHHLNFLIALASLFGGFMLMFNDKQGWLLSLICTSIYIVTFTRSSQANAKDNSQPYYDFFKSYSLMALLFLIILILLIQKPFRKKYEATAKNWLWVVGIIVVLLIDKFFI